MQQRLDPFYLKAGSANVNDTLIVNANNEVQYISANNIAIGAFTGGNGITIEANGLIVGSSSLTDTDDLPEGSANLYFTNTRAVGALTGGTGITIESNGLIVGSSTLEDTDDLPEGTANLYFTNTRAVGAFTAGNTIIIEANGYIDTRAVSAFLSYASSQTFTGNGVQQVFTLNSSVEDPDTLLISINGSVKVPETDYTVSGNQLTFTAAPADTTTVEVRYLNVTTSTALEYFTRTYTGDGTANTFAISSGLAPNAVVVFENGLAQVPYADYTIVGANLIFNTPPGSATTIQIRELPLQGREFTEIIGNTSNIIEGANLYFTNTRAVGAFTEGDNIVIESNGVISANVVGALASGDNIVVEANGMIVALVPEVNISPSLLARRSILSSMVFG